MRVRPTIDFAAGLKVFELPDPASVVIRESQRDRLRQKYKLSGAAAMKARASGIAKRKGYGKRAKSRVVYA